MSTIRILYIAIIAIFFSLCITGSAYSQQNPSGVVTAHIVDLAEQGDSIHIGIEYRILAQALNQRQSWVVFPQLVHTDASGHLQIKNFPYVLVNGRMKEKHYRRQMSFGNKELLANLPYLKTSIHKQTDEVLHYTAKVPFEPWMVNASLYIQQFLLSSADKRQIFSICGLNPVKLQPRDPYRVRPQVNFITPEKEAHKARNLQGKAYLDFYTGSSTIDVNFRRNPEELGKIADVMVKVLDKPDMQITALFIEGYASPEGSYALNERLAKGRAVALKSYMVRAFELDDALFNVKSLGEDWEGFRAQLTSSRLLQAQKDKILGIIQNNDTPDAKERKLRELGNPWKVMVNEMFPPLRRVDYRVDFLVKDYTLEESRYLSGKSPEMLSQLELFTLAQTYPDNSRERQTIFDTIFRLYPDDLTAMINASAIMLLRGEDTTAKRYLDKIADDPRAQNNLGVYYLNVGELDKAGECFRKAAESGITESIYNLEEVERKRADNEMMKRYAR